MWDILYGEVREDPSNITSAIDINQNEYTELEYIITPTVNVTDQNLCFRVTNNGDEFDTYLSVAQMNLRFEPVVNTITLNNGQPISLLPGTTTRVYATGTVSDLNGYTDLLYATSTIYRGLVAGGASCTPNNNNCYVSSTETATCSFIDCASDSCTVSCYADIYFHADPTDAGDYSGQEWFSFVEVTDASAGYGFAASPGVVMSTLRAIEVNGVIDYGAIAVNADTGSYNASTSIFNLGNVAIDIEITGTDLSDGIASVIPADKQKFATSTFTYSACGGNCALLSSTTPVSIDGFRNGNYDITPVGWEGPSSVVGSEETYGHWGLTSDDVDHFAATQTYVSASTTPVEVFTHSGPTDGTTTGQGTTRVGYTVQIGSLQEAADDYQATLTYVATPVF